MTAADPPSPAPPVIVPALPLSRPIAWLAAGWRDLWRQPAFSLAHGLAVTLAGLAILFMTARLPYLFTAALSGFLLVAPLLATGLYEASRRHAQGETPAFGACLAAWRRHRGALTDFGLMLLIAGTLWQVVSAVLVALLYKGSALAPLALVLEILRNPEHTSLFLAYLGAGGVLAGLTFTVSVVSMPLLVDRGGDLIAAMNASIGAVAENPLTLAFWATLLMVLTAVGFATVVGLIVVFPWLGHASWHAYRDLVR